MLSDTPKGNRMPKAARRELPHGLVASSVTPFKPDGSIDFPKLKPHIDWLIEERVAGISPLGSSGEFFAMESDQRKRLVEAVIEAIDGRVPSMVGTHHYSTKITVDLSKHAEKAGADSLLVVPPYYGLPTAEGVMDHYRRIADAVSIPVVMYHNTAGTNVDLGTAHMIKLFEEGVLAGVKMSHLMPDRMVELLQAGLKRATIYAGIDYVAFEGLSHGAHGWISAIPSLTPSRGVEMYEAIAKKGDLVTARKLWKKLAPLMRFVFQGSHISRNGPAPHWAAIMKTGLGMIGPDVGQPLAPSSPLDPENTRILAGLLKDLGYKVREPKRGKAK
ncbi:MAG: dihydrodipicolinate synthase family protein [Alphaproteobacteria bacterium]|nr:dihydrodipicolinate synthase family protein [Alphaproteobacteria bacterium]